MACLAAGHIFELPASPTGCLGSVVIIGAVIGAGGALAISYVSGGGTYLVTGSDLSKPEVDDLLFFTFGMSGAEHTFGRVSALPPTGMAAARPAKKKNIETAPERRATGLALFEPAVGPKQQAKSTGISTVTGTDYCAACMLTAAERLAERPSCERLSQIVLDIAAGISHVGSRLEMPPPVDDTALVPELLLRCVMLRVMLRVRVAFADGRLITFGRARTKLRRPDWPPVPAEPGTDGR